MYTYISWVFFCEMWQQSFLMHLKCHAIRHQFCHAFEMPSDSWSAIPFLTGRWKFLSTCTLKCFMNFNFNFCVASIMCRSRFHLSPLHFGQILWFFFSCWATFPPTSFFLVLVNLCYFLVPLKTNRFLMFSPFRLSSVSFIVAHGGIVYSDFHLVLLTLLFISFIPVSQ
jgi:hypothetical protein